MDGAKEANVDAMEGKSAADLHQLQFSPQRAIATNMYIVMSSWLHRGSVCRI